MIAVATAASIAIPEIVRLENSISAWDESWGTSAFAWQVGQCGQPSPDAVRRTSAPVVTTSQSSTSVAIAVRWKLRRETERNRRRASDGVSAWAISCQCNPAPTAGALTTPSRKYHANTAFHRFTRLQTGGPEWHSLGVVGTR